MLDRGNSTSINAKTTIKNGTLIPVLDTEFNDACIIGVEVGTNGYQGGNAGCLTYIKVKLDGACVNEFRALKDDRGNLEGLEIVFEGDAELGCVGNAIQFMYRTLWALQNDIIARALIKAQRKVGSVIDDDDLADAQTEDYMRSNGIFD